ncbi:uncharacterized protein LOC134788940, partial [Penaeus indicus]|uniref:uncharacterized protein LOC134788940 n=1 Tax=Penaeus indicus TaxID=29960 RepID=UPI00300C8F35
AKSKQLRRSVTQEPPTSHPHRVRTTFEPSFHILLPSPTPSYLHPPTPLTPSTPIPTSQCPLPKDFPSSPASAAAASRPCDRRPSFPAEPSARPSPGALASSPRPIQTPHPPQVPYASRRQTQHTPMKNQG